MTAGEPKIRKSLQNVDVDDVEAARDRDLHALLSGTPELRRLDIKHAVKNADYIMRRHRENVTILAYDLQKAVCDAIIDSLDKDLMYAGVEGKKISKLDLARLLVASRRSPDSLNERVKNVAEKVKPPPTIDHLASLGRINAQERVKAKREQEFGRVQKDLLEWVAKISTAEKRLSSQQQTEEEDVPRWIIVLRTMVDRFEDMVNEDIPRPQSPPHHAKGTTTTGYDFEEKVFASIERAATRIGWTATKSVKLGDLISDSSSYIHHSHRIAKKNQKVVGAGLKQEVDVTVRDALGGLVGALEVKLAAQNPFTVIHGDLPKYVRLLSTLSRAGFRSEGGSGRLLPPIYVVSDEAFRDDDPQSIGKMVSKAAQSIRRSIVKGMLSRHVTTCCSFARSRSNPSQLDVTWDEHLCGGGNISMETIVRDAEAATRRFFQELAKISVYVFSESPPLNNTKKEKKQRSAGPR